MKVKIAKIDYTKQYPEVNELQHISGNAFGTYNLATSRKWEYLFLYHECPPQGRVLDAGAGADCFQLWLDKKGFDTYACDIYPHSTTLINCLNNSNIHFTQATICHLPYKDKVFDVVYCISVLEHIHPFSKVIDSITELYRVTEMRLGITVDYGEDVEGLTQQQVKDMLTVIGIIEADVPDITLKDYSDGIKYSTMRRSILGIVIDKW